MARRRSGRLTATAILIALSMAVSPSAITPPKIAFTDTKLSNGPRLIVAEDHVAPVFSIAVIYNVGSRDERQGRTGFAHLFEHMMFKGSENVGPGEHFYTIFSNGGTMNGTTNKERTLYFETMPANQLEAGLFLEADRMRSLAIVKDNLDNQRKAVQEERRQGLDNQPYGRTNEAVDELAFDNPAYKHSVIGSMEDLERGIDPGRRLVLPDLLRAEQRHHRRRRRRDDAPAVRALARKYFESIPAQPAPPAVDITETPQTSERRLSLDDPLATAAAARRQLPHPLGPLARRRRGRRAQPGALGRPQLALLREHRAAEAARGERQRVRAGQPRAAAAADHRHADAGQVASTSSKRRSTRRSSG